MNQLKTKTIIGLILIASDVGVQQHSVDAFISPQRSVKRILNPHTPVYFNTKNNDDDGSSKVVDDFLELIHLDHLSIDDDKSLLAPVDVASDRKDNNDDKGVFKARALLVGAAALYGTNFSLVKILGDSMPEGISLTLRFSLAALVTLPWLFEENVNDMMSNKDVWMATWLGFEVGLWNSIGYVAQAVGLETTDASKSAFICSLAVVVVPLLDFVNGKRIETRQIIGAILAVVGVAVLELGGASGTTIMSASSSSTANTMLSTGDLLSLVQPFAFGIGFWRIEKALNRYPTEAKRLTAAQLLAVFIASLCYGFSAIDSSTLQSYPWQDWLTSPMILFSIFWTGVITTALTIFMENKAMETLSAAEATVIFATEPIWGTAFAAVVLSEQLGVNSFIGGALILSACFYSNLGLGGLQGFANRIDSDARQVPAKVQQQAASFSTSVAASWASWNVAVASAAEGIPDYDFGDYDFGGLEEIVKQLMDKLP